MLQTLLVFSVVVFHKKKNIYTEGCFRQSHFKKVVLWARYIKHNLRFPLICAGWLVFKAKAIFTDRYTWQNFRLRILCLVNRLYAAIHKTQNL